MDKCSGTDGGIGNTSCFFKVVAIVVGTLGKTKKDAFVEGGHRQFLEALSEG